MSIRCEICNRGPEEGVTVYRANEKGVKGIWRCADHPCKESMESQAATGFLVSIIEGAHEA